MLATHIGFEFLAPVYIGDTVTATCTVKEADGKRGWMRMELTGTTQDNRLVVRGEARGYPARFCARVKGQGS